MMRSYSAVFVCRISSVVQATQEPWALASDSRRGMSETPMEKRGRRRGGGCGRSGWEERGMAERMEMS